MNGAVKSLRHLQILTRKHTRLRELARWFFTSLGVKRYTLPELFIFSSVRSGSTWVMEVLSVAKGIRFINEPLGQKCADQTGLRKLDVINGRMFDCTDRRTLTRVIDFLKNPDNTEICGPYAFYAPFFHWAYNRRLLKIVHANYLLPDIAKAFPKAKFIYLVRHPAACIRSVMQAEGMDCECEHILHQLQGKSVLDSEIYEFGKEICRSGTDIQRRALEWGLDQIVALDYLVSAQPENVKIFSYEDFYLNPKAEVQKMADFCELEVLPKMLKSVEIPSSSTNPQELGKDFNDTFLMKWKESFSSSDLDRMFEVLCRLGVVLYDQERAVPDLTSFP